MNFEIACKIVLGIEKGITTDAGGLTNFGISQNAYPDEDIKNITVERAMFLYKRDYWDRIQCDLVSPRARLAFFDGAVQHGQVTSIKLMQQALRIDDDGKIGNQTKGAFKIMKDDHIVDYLWIRHEYYKTRPDYAKNRAGWEKRLFMITLHCGAVGVL